MVSFQILLTRPWSHDYTSVLSCWPISSSDSYHNGRREEWIWGTSYVVCHRDENSGCKPRSLEPPPILSLPYIVASQTTSNMTLVLMSCLDCSILSVSLSMHSQAVS